MYSLNLGDGGRVLSATYQEFAPCGVAVETLPEGNIADYRYADGVFVLDALPVEAEPEAPPSVEARVERLEEDTAEMREAFDILTSGVTV